MFRERKSTRLYNYDYSKANLYFVTTNIRKRFEFFGNICEGKMSLSEYGKIAEEQWLWMAKQYSYIKLHAYVIMPDHMHGILEITNRVTTKIVPENDDDFQDYFLNQNHTKVKPLDQLMGAYKMTVSKLIHLSGNCEFRWQRRFHEHIIRNTQSYHNITDYIISNPANWKKKLLSKILEADIDYYERSKNKGDVGVGRDRSPTTE